MRQEYGNDIFYHYTDFQALDGILSHAQLRVNNVLNMNDAAEMRHFMKGLRNAVVKRLEDEGEKIHARNVRELFEEELEKEFAAMAEAYNMDVDKVKERMGKTGIDRTKENLAVEKAADLIVEQAVETEEPKEEKSEEESARA